MWVERGGATQARNTTRLLGKIFRRKKKWPREDSEEGGGGERKYGKEKQECRKENSKNGKKGQIRVAALGKWLRLRGQVNALGLQRSSKRGKKGREQTIPKKNAGKKRRWEKRI